MFVFSSHFRGLVKSGLILSACFLVMQGVFVPAATARMVDILWSQNGTERGGTEKGVVLRKGLASAVVGEAMEIAPPGLSAERIEALKEILTEKCIDFVLSYSEAGVTDNPEGRILHMDVNVNQRALETWLKMMGLFRTGSGARTFDIMVSGIEPADSSRLNRLQILSGLVVQQGAEPRMVLERQGEVWRGMLETGDDVLSDEKGSLEGLWLSLWGGYFARGAAGKAGQEAGQAGPVPVSTAGAVVLEVRGWYTPDGVQAFDKILAEWKSDVTVMELTKVDLNPTGISARWLVKIRNQAGLNDRLQAYMSGRGLRSAFIERSE